MLSAVQCLHGENECLVKRCQAIDVFLKPAVSSSCR